MESRSGGSSLNENNPAGGLVVEMREGAETVKEVSLVYRDIRSTNEWENLNEKWSSRRGRST